MDLPHYSSVSDFINTKYWPVFGIDGISNTDFIWRYALCCVSIHSQSNDYNYCIYSALSSKISIWDWRNPKYWTNLSICCVFYTISTQWLQILKCTDLCNQCFKTCSWILLTMIKSLLLNSALLEIRIPAQLLIVHMQVQYWTKIRIYLHFAESTYSCGIPNK